MGRTSKQYRCVEYQKENLCGIIENGLGNQFYESRGIQMDDQSIVHTRYNCTYHIVFIPKYRRKVMYGQLGIEIGNIKSTVCKITGVQLIKGGVCPDHVHIYVSIPPKMSVSTIMSKIKGKSALMIFDRHPEYRDKYGDISGQKDIM